MCDVDEVEFAEYLEYVRARMAAPIPGSVLPARVRRSVTDLLVPLVPAES
jgi:hypothetical protein